MKATMDIPTHFLFGVDTMLQLGKEVRKYGRKALLLSGHSSQGNGVLNRTTEVLHAMGIVVVEFSGIKSSPCLSSIVHCVKVAREENCDVIIALGGNSVIDTAKIVATAFYYEGDPWDMFHYGLKKVFVPTHALPIIALPTLIVTGSERSNIAFVTNKQNMIKSFAVSNLFYPRVVIVDPALTLNVPQFQTSYGVCSLITNVTESYFNGGSDSQNHDRIAERDVKNLIEMGAKAVADCGCTEARTQLQWYAMFLFKSSIKFNRNYVPPVHMILHTLSAHHDIPHGAGLAVLCLAWMRFIAKVRPERFSQFVRSILDLQISGNNVEHLATGGIDWFENFWKLIGLPTRLIELNIVDELFSKYAKESLLVFTDKNGKLPGILSISENDIVTILKLGV